MKYRVSSSIVSPKESGGDDRVLIRHLPDQAILVLLADGATGGGYGAMAAECFIGIMRDCVSSFEQAANGIRLGFRMADQRIGGFANACDTTGIALVVHDDRYLCASVGDSSIFMAAPDGIIELTQGQHRKPRVGSGIREPVLHEGRVTGPLLLASDGLLMSPDAAFNLVRAERDGENAAGLASAVTNQAERKWLFDDLAVVVIDCDVPNGGRGSYGDLWT